MPSTVTHAYFMMDIYEKLPINRKVFLKNEKDKLKFFSQSMDALYFYSSINIKKTKKVRAFANYFHTKKTNDFIINLTNYIKYNYYSNNPEVMGFLYSIISHYILDSTVHPYVYYKTGNFIKSDKNTYKYNSKHHILETKIDCYLIKTKEKILPRKYKHYKYLFNDSIESKELIDVIDFTFKETFGINNFSKVLDKSRKDMKIAFRLLRYDPYRIKYYAYKTLDFLTPKKALKISFASYSNKLKFDNYLNLERKTWYYPTTKRKKSNQSFIELYTKALNESIDIIRQIDSYIYDDKKVNLKKLLKNHSYATGMDLSKEQTLKYFEY